ncbi:hypothetical protein ACIO7M_31330 [Streptomyces toxytricini]|uniref:Integral membrane protein n=1 Tax=Streptomyces toxytricini TaxID=67369 RepID=A0ABW8EQN2_STRT5
MTAEPPTAGPHTPQPVAADAERAARAGRPRHDHAADWMFCGVYGTVLASGLLAALDEKGGTYTPFSDASWVLVTAITAALAHGYAHHMSGHRQDPSRRRWRLLAVELWHEWPMVAAALPTVLLLVLAGVFGWEAPGTTAVGLGLNTALLFGWGTALSLHGGSRLLPALAVGAADAAIGFAIIVANALIK